jgi:hypothetical protein
MSTSTYNPKTKEDERTKATVDKAKELGNEAVDKAKDVGNQALDKAKDLGNQAVEKAKDVGHQALDKAKETATSVGEMAGQAATTVGEKANALTSTAGSDIRALGNKLSENTPHEGVFGHASQAVAATLKEGGKYIEDAKLGGMAEDVTKMIKRHPIPAVLIGIGVGFCLGRILKD